VTDWQEINDLKRNPQAVGAAKRPLKLTYADWREKQTRFLKDMAREKEDITTRQAEYLIHLRDETELFSTAGGFSVASLIEDCSRNRLPDRYRGLSDDNCEFSRASGVRPCSRARNCGGCSSAVDSLG